MKQKKYIKNGIIMISDKWIPLYGCKTIKSLTKSIKDEIGIKGYTFVIRSVKDEFRIHMKDIVFYDSPTDKILSSKVKFSDFEIFFDKYCEAKNYPKDGYIYGFGMCDDNINEDCYKRADNVFNKLEYEN